jgi:hypothetical protein
MNQRSRSYLRQVSCRTGILVLRVVSVKNLMTKVTLSCLCKDREGVGFSTPRQLINPQITPITPIESGLARSRSQEGGKSGHTRTFHTRT